MSALTDKYKQLIDTANSSGIPDLQIAEADGVLHITGTAPNADVKNNLWAIYGQIDPNFLTGDVVMDIQVATAVAGANATVNTQDTDLNVRKGPGTDQPIVGKAAKGATVTIIGKANEQWWLIRTADGAEGYVYAQYLTPQ